MLTIAELNSFREKYSTAFFGVLIDKILEIYKKDKYILKSTFNSNMQSTEGGVIVKEIKPTMPCHLRCLPRYLNTATR